MNDTPARTHGIDINALGRGRTRVRLDEEQMVIEVKNLDLYYGQKQALKGVDMVIPRNRVTAIIGPSGCGKSTLLRCFNRMNDLVDGCRVEGEVLLDSSNIYDKDMNVVDLRRRVGLVFQYPNAYPKSIYVNVAYGLRLQVMRDRRRFF